MKNVLLFALLCIGLWSCGGKKDLEIKDFNLSINVPSKWKLNGIEDYGDGKVAEIAAGGLRALNIKEAKTTVDNLDMLVSVAEKIKDVEILDKKTLPNGFGIHVKDNGKKKDKKRFRYYIKKGDKQFICEPGPYYKEEHFDACIEAIASIK